MFTVHAWSGLLECAHSSEDCFFGCLHLALALFPRARRLECIPRRLDLQLGRLHSWDHPCRRPGRRMLRSIFFRAPHFAGLRSRNFGHSAGIPTELGSFGLTALGQGRRIAGKLNKQHLRNFLELIANLGYAQSRLSCKAHDTTSHSLQLTPILCLRSSFPRCQTRQQPPRVPSRDLSVRHFSTKR